MIRRSALNKARGLLSERSVATTTLIHFGRTEQSDVECIPNNVLTSEFLPRSTVFRSIHKDLRRFFSSSVPDLPVTRHDFFGEKITLLDVVDRDAVVSAYDHFLLAVLTKGKSAIGGGNEEGLQIKAAHSAAMAWSELLEISARQQIPMAAVVAVGPILAQADVTYLRRVDELLQSTVEKVQFVDIANRAIAQKNNVHLTKREQIHLQALDLLMQHKRADALKVYLYVLQMCPGDVLALSLAIDLAATVGNKEAALHAATSVYSYWQDRQSVISGYSIGAALIAVGMAAGGRAAAAEGLLHKSVSQIDLEGCTGIASWAFANIYDAEGRVAEGISALNGYDGVKRFESAGLLFFDSHLGGYGARFALDREGERDARSIQRVYDESFSRVFLDSGYATRTPLTKTERRAPTNVSQIFLKPAGSLFSNLFGSNTKDDTVQMSDKLSLKASIPTTVDTLTWLPPTPQLLVAATFLLLRITLHGSIDGSDHRWKQLQNSWLTLLDQYEGDYCTLPQSVRVASSLACHNIEELRFVKESNVISGARQLGNLMCLGLSPPATPSAPEDWKKAVLLLHDNSEEYDSWEIDARPLFEIAVCYAACMTERDLESLSIARCICSRGVALRTNSPEEWWRYSQVLERLGDKAAADEARAASISMGSGEGGYGVH